MARSNATPTRRESPRACAKRWRFSKKFPDVDEGTRKIRNRFRTAKDELANDDVARHWSDIAGDWQASVRLGHDVYRELFNVPAFRAFVGDVRGTDVLDAGCGEGQFTRMLSTARRTTGIDLAPKMIELAREAEAQMPLGIEYVLGSFSSLRELGLSDFDHVVSFMALMDGPDLTAAIASLRGALKVGGTLSFAILHPCFFTPALGWWHGQDGPQLQVSRYFDETSRLQSWRPARAPTDGVPFVVPRFHRTVSTYLNALVDAGFRVTRTEEPRPSPDACAAFPAMSLWRDHASLFLYVRATRE